MPKLIWVALPLLLALALWVLLLMRRRSPSRHALNVWSSLLLLAYVATTAGLGIFWVANQQLPVFDWHYLFGYTTVALVALHLSFNFRILWRHITRSPTPAPMADMRVGGDAAQARRRVFGGLLAGLTAAGAVFFLGLRQGRGDLRVRWPAAGGSAGGSRETGGAAPALALVERYHALSATSRADMLLRAPGADWGNPPPSFKRYPQAAQVALPPPGSAVAATAFDLAALAATLWHTAGITETRAGVRFRASPSAGALFSTELYVQARAVPGLAPGLWHYDAQSHALRRLASRSSAHADAASGDAAALVIATAVFRRTGHKYGDRTYRYVLADLGHALENLRVAAESSAARAHLVGGFDEAKFAAMLGIDEDEEGVLALVALHPRPAPLPAPAAAALPPARGPRHVPPAPFAKALPLGVTNAVHLATSLRVAEPPADERPGSLVLPRAAAAEANRLDVIAARRSVRRFAATPLRLDALGAILAGMTAAGGAARLSSAVRVNVVVNAVAGMPPGAYRHEPASHALVARRPGADLRAAARAAALDQDVVGDAAVVLVLSIDRAAFAADPAGPARGYRHAFLEAGLVGERVYLEAGARGLGACAVGAFFDDEAAALVAVDPQLEWVVHFVALGVASR